MDEQKVQLFKEDFALLVEAGFIAVKQLDEISAKRLFHAAQVLSPESTAPQIGMGYIALNKLEMKEATKIFKEVSEKEPENQLAKTFLGICYLLNKARRKKGEEIINEVLAVTADPTIKSLGELALVWADKDLSKFGKTKKMPFFMGAGLEQSEEGEEEEAGSS